MEENKTLTVWQSAIANSERKFTEIAKETEVSVVYKAESMFAFQALSNNQYLMETATKNADSLRDSIINIASIGLSLNPAMQYAYLVPRDGKVCLDVSYKGLIKLATDSGSMLWVRADLVYSNDTFKYRGPAQQPIHEADVFGGDRGIFKGTYCIAKTLEGDILVEVMTDKEILQVRDSSTYYAKKKSGPWKDWFGEMTKKTIIKRASKTWPRSDKNDRLARAISVINEHEGIEAMEAEFVQMITTEQVNILHSLMTDNEVDKEKFLKFAGVSSIEQIPPKDYDRCLAGLKAMVKK